MYPVHQKDFYKTDHRRQYPSNTQMVYSNLTPRSSRLFPWAEFDGKIVWFGLQAWIKDFLIKEWQENFFDQPKASVLGTYKRRLDTSLGLDAVPVEHIGELHDLGYLPVEIKSLPEGSKVNIGIPCLTIHNTDERFFWLTNFLETVMSADLWKPTTTATIAHQYKKLLRKYAEETGGDIGFVALQGHDFSFRGMSGRHDAMMSGMGHLASFIGTDTIPAIDAVEKYYGADADKDVVGVSVSATEHSVMCLSGKDNEDETFLRLIRDVYPRGIVSIVSDTWDFWNVVRPKTGILAKYREVILNRKEDTLGLAKVVIRPDCYDEDTQVLTNSGFKFFKDLKESDLVAQVGDDGCYTFVKPLKYVELDYEGEMYHFTDHYGKVDLMVTPNHRMVVNVNGREKIIFAEDMGYYGHHYQQMYRSARQNNFYSKLTDYERLMIAFQADGSYQTGTNKIRFSFSKERKMQRLEGLLNSQEISYTKYYLKDGRVEYNINVDAKDFHKDFSWVQVSDISFKYAQDFIEELSYWDATRRSDGRFKFDTTNEDVVAVVELLAIAAGYGVLVSKTEDNRKGVFSDIYTAHILKDNAVGGQSWSKTKLENFSGKVYCVQVPTGKIIVKRGRCTMVCGNSGDPIKVVCGLTSMSYKEASETWVEDYEYLGVNVIKKDGKFYKYDCSGIPDSFGWVDERTLTLKEEVSEVEVKGAIECLWDEFGGSVNDKGYKVLNPRVGLIYGDSITLERAKAILEGLKAKGFCSSNIVFGIGSYTYQYITRDTFGFAVKATAGKVDGNFVAIQKDPITDSGTKKSAKGFLVVDKTADGYALSQDCTFEDAMNSGALQTVFRDGKLVKEVSFNDIRTQLESYF